MSDFTDTLLGEKSTQQLQEEEDLKRHLERISYDKVKIFNPTNEDFDIVWNGFSHTVPNKNKDVGYGKGTLVVERYLANKYIKDMSNKIGMQMIDEAVKQKNKEREKQGMPPMNHYQERPVFEQRHSPFNKPDAMNEILETLYGGLVSRFGATTPVERAGYKQNKPQSPAINSFMAFMLRQDRDSKQDQDVVEELPKDTVINEQRKEQAVSQLVVEGNED